MVGHLPSVKNMVDQTEPNCESINKVFVFRSFVATESIQIRVVEEAILCHSQNEIKKDASCSVDFEWTAKSTTSLKLNLGISCGGDLSDVLPDAVVLARKAFRKASIAATATNSVLASTLNTISEGPLSGLALLYGINASMPSHYDSPTQPGQREEWLCMMTFGNTILFRCNNEVISLNSGDVLVMDSMAVLHGVEQIVADNGKQPICTRVGLPYPQIRLGILFWQGTKANISTMNSNPFDTGDFDAFHRLFANDNDSE